jgi:hypothetical protein
MSLDLPTVAILFHCPTRFSSVGSALGGMLRYDFWLNPTNPQTRGLTPSEIKSLFPNCTYQFHKITLAPPIARKLVPLSWGLGLFLEGLKLFNSHYLAAIRPKTGNQRRMQD